MADGNRLIIGQANIASNPGAETSLSRNEANPSPVFVVGNLNAGDAIHGTASSFIGVRGTSDSGVGVEGTSDSNFAVAGDSTSSVGVGGRSSSSIGVQGISDSSFGVLGNSTSSGGVGGRSSSFIGVVGESIGESTSGTGVFGQSTNSHGVSGQSTNSFGGSFTGPQSTTGSSGSLRLDGNVVKFNGEYSEALPHPDGSQRLLYAPLSPESWYEDFGRGELVEGRGRVEFDPDFAAILGIDDGHYHVYLTPEGDSNGLYVSSRSPTAFEVHEQQGGTSSLTFSYRVVAKRKDGQPERLAKVEEPENMLESSRHLRRLLSPQERA
jgi:hypothetical protein